MREIDEHFFDKTDEIKKSKLEDYLEQDEKILWRATPKKSSYVLSKAVTLLPIALIFLIVDVSMIIGIGVSTKEAVVIGTIIPFFLIHMAPVWILIAQIIRANKQIKNTQYAITNKRVLCKSGMYSEQFLALEFDKIISVKLKRSKTDKMFKTGDIYISGKDNSFVLFDIYDSEFITNRLNKILKSIDRDEEFYKNYHECPHCGSYVEKSLKKCPNCGAINEEFHKN